MDFVSKTHNFIYCVQKRYMFHLDKVNYWTYWMWLLHIFISVPKENINIGGDPFLWSNRVKSQARTYELTFEAVLILSTVNLRLTMINITGYHSSRNYLLTVSSNQGHTSCTFCWDPWICQTFNCIVNSWTLEDFQGEGFAAFRATLEPRNL